MPAPIWDTFCGVSNGLWIGTAAAYNPYTGDYEGDRSGRGLQCAGWEGSTGLAAPGALRGKDVP